MNLALLKKKLEAKKMNLDERNENNKSFFSNKASVYDEVHKVLMNTKEEAITALEDNPSKNSRFRSRNRPRINISF